MADTINIIDPAEIQRIIALNDALAKTATQLKAVITEAEKTKDSYGQGAMSMEEYNKAMAKAQIEQQKLAASAKEMANQNNQLVTTEAKIQNLTSQTNKELTDKKRILAEENEILKQNSILTDKNTGSLQKAIAQNKLLEIEKKKLNLATKEGENRLKEINAEQDKNNELIKDSSNTLQKQKINVGNYKSAFGDLFGQFKNGEIGVKELIKGVFQLGKSFMIAIVSNPILLVVTAIIAAVVGLAKAFLSTDSGADLLAKKMEALRAIFDVVRQVAAGVAQSIVSIFTGDKEKAAQQYADATGNIAEKLKAAAKAGEEYAQQMDAIEESETNYISQAADIRNEVAKLDFESQNKALSPAQREKALTKLLELEKQDSENRKKLINDKFNAEADYLAAKSGLDRQSILSIIKMSDEERGALTGNMATAFDVNRKKFDDLEQTYADMVNADTVYFEENKRRYSRQTGFEEELKKDREQAAKEAADRAKEEADRAEKQLSIQNAITENVKKGDLLQIEMNRELAQSERELTDFLENEGFEQSEAGKKQAEDAQKLAEALTNQQISNAELRYQQELMLLQSQSKNDEEFAQKKFDLDKRMLQSSIDAIKSQLDMSTLSADKRIELETLLANKQLELQGLVFDDQKEKDAQTAERKQQMKDAAISLASELFSFMDSIYSSELESLEQKNASGQISDQEYAKKKAEIEIKQAKMAKAQGLFDVGIKTAQAIIGFLAKPGGPAGIALSILAGVTGALQAAAILAKPLPAMPSFAEGTKGQFNTPYTYLAGEAGTEAITNRFGQVYIADKPTVFSGSKWKGARVTSNPEFEYIMSHTGHTGFGAETKTDDRTLLVLNRIEKHLKAQKTPITDGGNRVVGWKQDNTTTKMLNRYKHVN